jgi:hypothetical protein
VETELEVGMGPTQMAAMVALVVQAAVVVVETM